MDGRCADHKPPFIQAIIRGHHPGAMRFIASPTAPIGVLSNHRSRPAKVRANHLSRYRLVSLPLIHDNDPIGEERYVPAMTAVVPSGESITKHLWEDTMAGSVNKVILIGNLGRDPEIRTTQSGMRIANLSIATSDSWRDKESGERRERTEWHRVVIFDERLAETAERYLRKGSKVYLEGSLQTRKWTDQNTNTEKYTTEVVLSRFRSELTMLDSKGEMSGGGYESAGSSAPMLNSPGANPPGADAPSGMPANPGQGGKAGGGVSGGASERSADMDDDIPF